MKAFRHLAKTSLTSTRQISHFAPHPRAVEVSRNVQRHLSKARPRITVLPASYHTEPSRRFQSTESASPGTAQTANANADAVREDVPAYALTFTCKPCNTRSSHRISKQAYHYGATLVTCPHCKNRHIMSDHLGIFIDKGQGGTLEDILQQYAKGEGQGTLKKGFVDGDLEFWDDGTVKQRKDAVGDVVEVGETPDRKVINLGKAE